MSELVSYQLIPKTGIVMCVKFPNILDKHQTRDPRAGPRSFNDGVSEQVGENVESSHVVSF